MSAFNFLLIFYWLPALAVIVKKVMAAVYLWQVKEFRLDRVLAHLREDESPQMQQQIFTFVKIGLFTALIMYLLSPYSLSLLLTLPIIFLVYINEAVLFLETVTRGKFIRPKIKSVRNLLLICGSIILLLLPLILIITSLNDFPAPADSLYRGFSVSSPAEVSFADILPREENAVLVTPLALVGLIFSALAMIAADLLAFLVVAAGVLLTSPLAFIRRRMLISRAAGIIKQNRQLRIIGVTGSYGKSTTKEMIYQLLKKNYRVVATRKNNNTVVGIALTINNHVKSTTEILVAEMGAYTRGEIAESARLAPPDVAIITGIEEQHLALFGNVENILRAKYEIVEYMKPDGLAIFNGDNEYCLRLAEKTRQRKKIYFAVGNNQDVMTQTIAPEAEEARTQFPVNENTYARNLAMTNKGVSFDLQVAGEIYKVSTNLQAKYYVANLLAAIMAVNEVGLEIKEIVEIINKTDFDLPYLQIYQGVNESMIIDDGYNANTRGMLSALDYLAEQKKSSKDGKKIRKGVLTQGIIELGKAQSRINKKVAEKLVKSADYLLTTDKSLRNAVLAADKEFECWLLDTPARFAAYYKEKVQPGDLVLIEGSMPKLILDQIYLPPEE